MKQTLEEYTKNAFGVFDGSFMKGDDVDERERFYKSEKALALIREAYEKGMGRDELDDALLALWDDMAKSGEL